MPRTLLARPGSSHMSPRTNSVRPPMRSRPHVLPRPKARARPQGDSSANGSVTSSRRRFASSCLTTSVCGTTSAGQRLTAERVWGKRPANVRICRGQVGPSDHCELSCQYGVPSGYLAISSSHSAAADRSCSAVRCMTRQKGSPAARRRCHGGWNSRSSATCRTASPGWRPATRYPQRQCVSGHCQSHRSSMPGCSTYSSAADRTGKGRVSAAPAATLATLPIGSRRRAVTGEPGTPRRLRREAAEHAVFVDRIREFRPVHVRDVQVVVDTP
jgi:hypothetical protein